MHDSGVSLYVRRIEAKQKADGGNIVGVGDFLLLFFFEYIHIHITFEFQEHHVNMDCHHATHQVLSLPPQRWYRK